MSPSTLLAAATATTATATSGDSLVDLMVANYNRIATMGWTENDSPTFLSTCDPCLDFFFHVVPHKRPEDLNKLLKAAWKHDPLKTLKLVANLRGVGGTGKCDKEGFYTAALWLHNNHPRTLASNLASFADFGNFNDLLEILFRVQEGADARELQWMRRYSCIDYGSDDDCPRRRKGRGDERQLSIEEKRIERAKKVAEKINGDPNLKFLHDCVSDVFAQWLRSDLKLLDSGDLGKISTAAKWCPSVDSKLDRTTLLCESIARKVFPEGECVRDGLRDQVLVPLRKALQLPEVYMEASDWGSIPYDKVSSEDMITHKEKFLKHNKRRFQEYLARVKSGESKIAASAKLLPRVSENDPVTELQWKSMVEEMGKKGKMKNCLAICDVSETHYMYASVALGILVSELSQEPWKGKLITFNQEPKLHLVQGESMTEKINFIQEGFTWSSTGCCDLQKVFDVILKVAVEGKLRGEEMVKRVFVFSDMGFGIRFEISCDHSDYEEIEKKFRENGYGDCVPEIVFWNLSGSKASPEDDSRRGTCMATPVLRNQPGVALVSGYSTNLMSLFLEENGEILDPEAVMEAAISGEEYQRLLVVD
ncbi:hypothetical protein ACS0TY_032757 [Phlomoides rotata]